ncbi:EscS/YscS/HrcS family type III secretion system export apparatus protein [Pseudaestuariivita rosea]|uniref:EscS/YscS/HrcS family type III secretion system export apparatus protein n=1 Tax=Pseudaestuariivita rosea TaxID=2763263 RepID=UPI001ABA3B2A|nr:flagellar biosynthetic protein FliQ [Pseudaestuariivita rosea]
MEYSDILITVTNALGIFMTIVLPPLAAALAVGLIVGVLQAATQIQDQTLPQTVKLFVVIGVFASLAGSIFYPLTQFTESIFAGFPTMVP